MSGDREQMVRSLLQGGRYASEDEVIDDALRLLQERDDEARLAALRRDVVLGVEQADRGELRPFDPRTTLTRVCTRQAAEAGHS